MMMLRLPRLVDQEGYEKGDDDEEGDEADDDVVDDDGDELLREDEDSSYLDFRRKNIVDACCRNACTEDEFHQFCKLGGQGRPATTTTTTPPPPPPSRILPEEQSQIYPYLLRMLTWIIPAKPEQQSAPEQEPQSSPRIADSPLIYEMSGGRISPSSRLQIPNSSRFINGGTTTSGGIFGMPSFHRRTTHPTRSHATHRRPPHPEESPATAGGPHMKLSVVTDPPIETKVGFGLGTHEGVLFNN